MRRVFLVVRRAFFVVLFVSMAQVQADSDKYTNEAFITSPGFKQYASECAACHTAYLPKFLPSESWKKIMGDLSTHYGVDASLKKNDLLAISTWLESNAAGHGKRSEQPPDQRITASRWFKKEHRNISPSVFQRASIKRAANCQTCHVTAQKGDYDDDNVRIPR